MDLIKRTKLNIRDTHEAMEQLIVRRDEMEGERDGILAGHPVDDKRLRALDNRLSRIDDELEFLTRKIDGLEALLPRQRKERQVATIKLPMCLNAASEASTKLLDLWCRIQDLLAQAEALAVECPTYYQRLVDARTEAQVYLLKYDLDSEAPELLVPPIGSIVSTLETVRQSMGPLTASPELSNLFAEAQYQERQDIKRERRAEEVKAGRMNPTPMTFTSTGETVQ
jgi:hypothetical protein